MSLDGGLVLAHLLLEPLHHQVDDDLDLVLRQLVEDDDLVDPVQELGAEDLLELAHDPVLHLVIGETGVVADGEAEGLVLRDRGRADVRRHDHDRVAEVDLAALASVSFLSSRIWSRMPKTSGWAFSISSSRTTEYGLAAHGLGELAALVVADVARRRADEPGHGVLLHVLRHVHLDHRVLVAEQELRERPREPGLPDARGRGR